MIIQEHVDNRYTEYIDHVFCVDDRCSHILHGWENMVGYMMCYFKISHIYLLSTSKGESQSLVKEATMIEVDEVSKLIIFKEFLVYMDYNAQKLV